MRHLLHFRHLILLALIGIAGSAPAAERVTYFVPDALGSPVAAMDAQGNVLWRENHAPYGQRQTRSPENPAKPAYTGKPEDTDTGLVYMGARMYDPETARFTGIDPQGFGNANPQSFGRYLYGNNAPYKYADPDGESPIDIGFLLYDVGVLIHASATGGDVGAAAMDVASSAIGVVSPMPGTGQMIKTARMADKISGAGHATQTTEGANKILVIGENMNGRVVPHANKIGGEVYPGMPGYKPELHEAALVHNEMVVRQKMAEGYEIHDIGPDLLRRETKGPSDAYEMEVSVTRGYENLIKVPDSD